MDSSVRDSRLFCGASDQCVHGSQESMEHGAKKGMRCMSCASTAIWAGATGLKGPAILMPALAGRPPFVHLQRLRSWPCEGSFHILEHKKNRQFIWHITVRQLQRFTNRAPGTDSAPILECSVFAPCNITQVVAAMFQGTVEPSQRLILMCKSRLGILQACYSNLLSNNYHHHAW